MHDNYGSLYLKCEVYNNNKPLERVIHSEGLLNSITMQVMLSAPSPSEVAKLEGHILSIISSTMRETTTLLFVAGST